MLTLIFLLLSAFFLETSNSLKFPPLKLSCLINDASCPRGQHCDTTTLSCVSSKNFRARTISVDGRCGPDFSNATCPESECCSSAGWCGRSYTHCVASCIASCNASLGLPTAGSVSDNGRCGAGYFDTVCPIGECCSVYGYCGSTAEFCGESSSSLTAAIQSVSESSSNVCLSPSVVILTSTVFSTVHLSEPLVTRSSTTGTTLNTSGSPRSLVSLTSAEPVLGKPSVSTVAPAAHSTLPVTTDGTCGLANGGTVCGDWSFGSCCSQYGYCGNSSSHCGSGCQSGDCLAPFIPVPGETTAQIAVGDDAGTFDIVGQSGVPAMHAALLPNGRVVFLDKVEDYTQALLPSGYFAYSSEYDPDTNTYTALTYRTNAFCSAGAFLANGDLVSVGGNADLPWVDPTVTSGLDGIRYLKRFLNGSNTGQDWTEPGNKLSSARWYPSAQTLADGRIFVASGSLNGLDPTVPENNNPTWELLDKTGKSVSGSVPMYILEHNQPYYMYPFIHLLRSGKLFVFVSKSSEIFDVDTNTTVLQLPDLPGDYRTYPNTGGSVMLPLSSDNDYGAEIMICGGGSYQDITSPTDASCGRIRPESDSASWELEGMPFARDMVESVLLPDGTSVWLNGGHYGAQGFNLSREPVLDALLYDPNAKTGSRFTVLAKSTIPRLYHSVALLVPDGTIMVAGSNPVEMPVLQPEEFTPYVTEFRVEVFTPPYLMGSNRTIRPVSVMTSTDTLANGHNFTLTYTEGKQETLNLKVVLYHGGFVTHSVHMGHRMVYLDYTGFKSGANKGDSQKLTVSMPTEEFLSVLPPGPYLLFVVADGIPSVGKTVYVNLNDSF
ncbi:glyoxal oxidase N-terminus-domain-containing protein [Lipomyces arxii]|uniref:glyoxal oxidase N-terminus-domain-containing protein n=1 Tax=Lipomyces arxii TaxID=56418 RepID=UPI0034CD3906